MAVESLNINPFADFGSIVSGERFVGRKKELKQISDRVLGKTYGNLAIMGLPRIGKSSLAWQSIMPQKQDLVKAYTIPIFLSIAKCKDGNSLFKAMINSLHDEMDFICDDVRYQKFSAKILDSLKESLDSADFSSCVQKYFKLIRNLGYKIIYILDEFDNAQYILNIADFQLLRELSYNPDYKLCYVTTTRKTLQEIEANNGSISNFYGIFQDLRLGLFNDNDIVDYWKRVEGVYSPTDNFKNQIKLYVGNHPFFLDIVNSYCFSQNVNNLTDFSQLEELKIDIWNQFKEIEKTLERDGILDTAKQLVLGPVYDVVKVKEEKLLRYSFLQRVDNQVKIDYLGRLIGSSFEGKSYVCFSQYFTQYFEQEHINDVDYWPLWGHTEKKCRAIINRYVSESFSSDWENEIVRRNSRSNPNGNPNFVDKWKNNFDKLINTRRESLRKYPNASNNLIDYTFPRDMYGVFMSKDWRYFGRIFPGAQNEWGRMFEWLADIRNPIAHNNSEFISAEDIAKATEYCNKILKAIGDWEANN